MTTLKKVCVSIFSIAAILAVIVVGILVLAANPDVFVHTKVVEQGSYLGFEIGMDRHEALEVVEKSFAEREGVFFSVFDVDAPQTWLQTPLHELVLHSNWYVAIGSYSNSVQLQFVENRLVYIKRHRNYLGGST